VLAVVEAAALSRPPRSPFHRQNPTPHTPQPQVAQRELAASDIIDRLLKDFSGQVLTVGQQVVFELQGLNLRIVVGSLLVSDAGGQNKDVSRAFLRDSTAFIFTNAGGFVVAQMGCSGADQGCGSVDRGCGGTDQGWQSMGVQSRACACACGFQPAASVNPLLQIPPYPTSPHSTPHPTPPCPTPPTPRPSPHQDHGAEGLRHQPALQVPHALVRVAGHRRPRRAV